MYFNFFSETKTPPRSFSAVGVMKNTNTMDDFKDCDKKQFIDAQARKVRYINL